jgi:hypothetical protein
MTIPAAEPDSCRERALPMHQDRALSPMVTKVAS